MAQHQPRRHSHRASVVWIGATPQWPGRTPAASKPAIALECDVDRHNDIISFWPNVTSDRLTLTTTASIRCSPSTQLQVR